MQSVVFQYAKKGFFLEKKDECSFNIFVDWYKYSFSIFPIIIIIIHPLS